MQYVHTFFVLLKPVGIFRLIYVELVANQVGKILRVRRNRRRNAIVRIHSPRNLFQGSVVERICIRDSASVLPHLHADGLVEQPAKL